MTICLTAFTIKIKVFVVVDARSEIGRHLVLESVEMWLISKTNSKSPAKARMLSWAVVQVTSEVQEWHASVSAVRTRS